MILAGGIGKRLKPITETIPKALVPINGAPIISWQIKYFKKFGVDEFVICTGYKGEKIEEYLESEKLTIHYSHEQEPLGTGGAIKNAAKYLNHTSFFVINGDVITDIDLTHLLSKPFSIATINLKTQYGTLDISDTDNLTVNGFQEKGSIPNYWMNAGIYHLSPDIIEELPDKGNIEEDTFPTLARKRLLTAIKYPNALWHSIDSHKDIEECEKSMKSKLQRFY